MDTFLSVITILDAVIPCIFITILAIFAVSHNNKLAPVLLSLYLLVAGIGIVAFVCYHFDRENLADGYPALIGLITFFVIFFTTIFSVILIHEHKRPKRQPASRSETSKTEAPERLDYIKAIRSLVGHNLIFLPAAACFIVQDGKILLQRRKDNQKWAAHGGILEPHEDFLEALNRELQEELGITPTEIRLIDIFAGKDQYHTYPNGDQCIVILASYLVTRYKGTIHPDPSEVLEVKWFSLDELPPDSEIHTPDLKSFHSLLALLSRPA